jgi:hypothetical protein
MTARLLIVCIDGADGRRLDRFSADGSLPNLAALRARGRVHVLTAPKGVTDDALWASFQYGVEVGEHGRYFYALPLSNGRVGKAHWAETDRPTFWDDLSEAGLQVAVIDVPKCRNPLPLNGIHLVDWLAHGGYFPKPRSQPKPLAAEVVQRFGAAPPSRFHYLMSFLDDAKVREVVGDLRTSVAMKRAAGLHYLASEPWDLFVIAFMEAHCACHTFWDFDAGHPDFKAARSARLGDPVMTVLRDIDAAVGDLVAVAGSSAEVVVFSTTDFQPNGSLQHLMPQIVDRLNARIAASRPDSAARPCSILPYNESCAALRIAGRRGEPIDGTRRRAPPDTRSLKVIERQLRGLRDAATGASVVSAITRPSSEMNGSRATDLPDLLVHWLPGRFPRAVVSPTLGHIEADPPSMRPGNHAAGGLVIAAGALAMATIGDVRTIAAFGSLARAVLDRETAVRPRSGRPRDEARRPPPSARSLLAS